MVRSGASRRDAHCQQLKNTFSAVLHRFLISEMFFTDFLKTLYLQHTDINVLRKGCCKKNALGNRPSRSDSIFPVSEHNKITRRTGGRSAAVRKNQPERSDRLDCFLELSCFGIMQQPFIKCACVKLKKMIIIIIEIY